MKPYRETSLPRPPERRALLSSWDGLILIPTGLLLLVGFLALYTASSGSRFLDSPVFRQAIWLTTGLLGVLLIRRLSPKFFYEYATYFYLALLPLLAATHFMPGFGGGQRWLVIGPLQLQPSEFGKIILVLALARFLTDYRKKAGEFPYVLVPILYALLPTLLIVIQPDLATALIYMAIVMVMMYWGGVSPLYLFIILAPAITLITAGLPEIQVAAAKFSVAPFFLWMLILLLVLYYSQVRLKWNIIIFAGNALFGLLTPFAWNSLQPYQQRRILTLFDAGSDPHGAGYQVLQSQTAIGSGGVFGKGLGEGTQTQLRFLPVSDTDFIIAVIGEELGFVAVLAVLILFGWLLLRMVDRASSTHNRFASLTIIGFTTILTMHVFVNMSMATGLMPVTGLPLPFMSYGGSFMLTCLAMVTLTNHLIAGEA